MKSVYNMVASKPECRKLGKDMKKYYRRNTWKDHTCIWQPVWGGRGGKKKSSSPLLITHFSSRPFSKMPVGGGAFARRHSILMSTTNINQIIHVT